MPFRAAQTVGTLRLVTSLRELLVVCDSDLRTRLDPDEQVVAIGRCEDITERGGPELGGAGWTFVMITDRRLRWVPHVNLRFEASLDLDTVTAVTERLVAHRYAVALEHPPITRAHHVPAHRFLMYEWGNAVGNRPFARTELAFSRRDTRAAYALREQLIARGRARFTLDPTPGPTRRGSGGLLTRVGGARPTEWRTPVADLGANKLKVLEFYDLAFNQGEPQKAVEQYVGSRYIQHNPAAGDGGDAFVGFVTWYRGEFPELSVELKRVIAEGDLVVTHGVIKTSPQDRGTAAVDIFRLEDGKIVEHWDVLQPVPEEAANDNTMF